MTKSSKSNKANVERVIKLNVGGELFMTLSSTLEKSIYFKNFLEGSMASKTIINGDEMFIDRSAQLFEEVLSFMRTSVVFCRDLNKLKALQAEAEYYAIPKMIQEVKAKIVNTANDTQLPRICIKNIQEIGKKRKFSLVEDTNGSLQLCTIIDTINIRGKCNHYSSCNCSQNMVPHLVLAHSDKV